MGTFLLYLSLQLILLKCVTPPNILFILIDDLGWGNLGYHQPNNTEIKTPNIDNLAKNGLRLNRHYVHYVCSPTRSSLQSGRLPVYVNINNTNLIVNPQSGIPINYTCIATKIKESKYNYSTHAIGKWDSGSATFEQTPLGRGYDTFFGYLSHSNSYWNETLGGNPCLHYGVPNVIDLWENNEPAYGQQNTIYESFIFTQKLYDILDNKTITEKPFFISYMPHLTHAPMQIPGEYLLEFDNDEHICGDNVVHPLYPGYNGVYNCRSIYQSMISILDDIIGNITSKLKENNLWDNTLVIFTGDNGGELLLTCCAANNYPLKGGKFSVFEGGIRTPTIISGGYLPNNRYGQIENGMVHISDWYNTILTLLNVSSTDTRAINAGLPDITSYDIWDLIIGKNNTSPRYEIPIDTHTLLQGNYKYIHGLIAQYNTHMGPNFPNKTTVNRPPSTEFQNCEFGCLYDVVNDMSEGHNIIHENRELANTMKQRLEELKLGYYSNNESGIDNCPNNITIPCSCWTAKNIYNNFYGPYQSV